MVNESQASPLENPASRVVDLLLVTFNSAHLLDRLRHTLAQAQTSINCSLRKLGMAQLNPVQLQLRQLQLVRVHCRVRARAPLCRTGFQ